MEKVGVLISDEFAGWIIAQDLLTRARNGFIIRALEVYRSEMKGKSVSLEGELVHMPDEHREDDEDLFVITKLSEQRDEVGRRYHKYIDECLSSGDAQKIIAGDRARKFLLALGHVIMLMDYSAILGDWTDAASTLVKSGDAVEIIAKTANTVSRLEVLEFIVNDKYMVLDGTFHEDEFNVFIRAVGKAKDAA